ncbi:MAG: YitT family protein [Vallitaleaceae bacterium]|jgi:uncharacterized membrane-anchored protein YitT (DUF2179 family)|nr:YitT family protein [Vallitaleaceae bacterium]
MEFKSRRKPIIDYIYMIIGTTFLAIAINLFLDPLELVTGGVTGIAIIIKALTVDIWAGGIPIWFTNIVINMPLFLVAVIIRGKNFGGRSLFGTVFLSFALYYTQWIPLITNDRFLGSIVGGALAGVGLSFVFLAFSTTGGTDLGASIIQHFIKHHSLAKIMFALDSMVILGGFFVFGAEKALYALISVFITSKVIDGVLDGFNYSKAAFIISNHSDLIARDIINILDRGATMLHGEGAFTGNDRSVILCVVSKKEIIALKQIAKKRDQNAFLMVADVREVLGEGFNEYKDV